ncbi:hypothetical protein MHK_000580 [Candidatus Magnetomorum sp. HK-1]|nr:hypothetical protein MHK_000580 [Candidatus Magnetomorum sp. HK-1]
MKNFVIIRNNFEKKIQDEKKIIYMISSQRASVIVDDDNLVKRLKTKVKFSNQIIFNSLIQS